MSRRAVASRPSPPGEAAPRTGRTALDVIARPVIGRFVGVPGGAGTGSAVSPPIGGSAYTGTAQFERVTTAALIAIPIASAAATVVFRRKARARARETAVT